MHSELGVSSGFETVVVLSLVPSRHKLTFKFSPLLTSKALCWGAFVLRTLPRLSTLWWQFCWVFLNECKTLWRLLCLWLKSVLMFHGRMILHFTIRGKDSTTKHPNLCQQIPPKLNLAALLRLPLSAVYVSEIWCNCRRHSAFSEENLSPTWDSRLESDNHHWLVTSVFSLNIQAFRGRDTQPPKELRILKIIYWWYLRVCALHVTLNIQMILDY